MTTAEPDYLNLCVLNKNLEATGQQQQLNHGTANMNISFNEYSQPVAKEVQ